MNRNSRQLCPNGFLQAWMLSFLQYRMGLVSPVFTYKRIVCIPFWKTEYVRNSSLHGFILIWWSTLGLTVDCLSSDCSWKPAPICRSSMGLPDRWAHMHTMNRKALPCPTVYAYLAGLYRNIDSVMPLEVTVLHYIWFSPNITDMEEIHIQFRYHEYFLM